MTNPCLHIDSQQGQNVMQVSSSLQDWWPASPPRQGWRLLKYRQRVGQGVACYDKVRDAALEWEFSDTNCGIVQVHHHAKAEFMYQRRESRGTGYDVIHNACFGDGDLYGPSGQNALKVWAGPGGRRLATFTSLRNLFCVNPVTVVYDLVDQRGPGTTYTSTAYATCKGHWLQGEERVTVAHRDGGAVDVEIVSYSKPSKSLWGRMIWPLVGPLQGHFFESQMKALENVAGQPSTSSHPTDYGMSSAPAVMKSASFNQGARRGDSVTQW